MTSLQINSGSYLLDTYSEILGFQVQKLRFRGVKTNMSTDEALHIWGGEGLGHGRAGGGQWGRGIFFKKKSNVSSDTQQVIQPD